VFELSRQLQDKLADLAEDFVRQMPKRFDEIDVAVDEQLKNVSGKAADVRHIRLLIHKLGGSGATFGLEKLSAKAKELELFLDTIIEEERTLDKKELSSIAGMVKGLREACIAEGECEGELEELDAPGMEPGMAPGSPLAGEAPSPSVDRSMEKKIVHLVDRNGSIACTVVEQLGYYGYDVEEIDELEGVQSDLEQGIRRLVIVNTDHLSHDPALSELLSKMKRRYPNQLGIIFVSVKEDFETRLVAVKAGGDAFFMLPLDIGRLVDRIDSLIARVDSAPYHVLIVDDDPEQVAYYAFLLQQAGMITSVASDPRTVLSILIDSRPELILMDMYMPDCSGINLAALLRQHDSFVGIPIVFLSFESNKDKQMEAVLRGGDDFLTKPINPEYLVQIVSTRAERNRRIRFFMERDSLTGLLNHSNLKEQLGREILRASRSEAPLSFVMIDADHFKRVNDLYGHLTGDRVLKNLARLLQDRLRRTDIIGRYGGEEFGVVLMNTNVDTAKKIMDEIRENFSRVVHQGESEQFNVTFSCGIAGYPGCEDVDTINTSADRALYEAKETGRNRVVVFRSEGK
jgi:diguanylate cyclase (GGDEF)-like protein